MRLLQVVVVATLGLTTTLPTQLRADDKPPKWQALIGYITSAYLASRQANIIASTSLAFPNGQKALVTFWKQGPATYRCLDFVDGDAHFLNGYCYAPSTIVIGGGEAPSLK